MSETPPSQGSAAPETTTTATNTTNETPTVTVEVEEKPKGKAGFSQKDLDKAAGSARNDGKAVGLKEKANELGFASVEEMEAAAKAHQQAESERMGQLEKVQKQLEKEQTRAAQLETSLTETNGKAKESILNAKATLAALALDTKPDRVEAVIELAKLSEIELDANFVADSKAVDQAIKDVLEKYPEFAVQSPNSIGDSGSNPPGEPPNPNPSPAQMTREQRDDIARRVMAGEKVSLS
jgi:hypothetical protein